MTENIFPVNSTVNSDVREKTYNQKAVLIWLTGLSGSGKTTIGKEAEKKLIEAGYHACLLDGDSLRSGLNKDLGFTIEDRNENIRRAGEVCKLMTEAGLIVITTFISPLRSQRDSIRSEYDQNRFIEVFIDTPLQICEERDLACAFIEGVMHGSDDMPPNDGSSFWRRYHENLKKAAFPEIDKIAGVYRGTDNRLTYLAGRSKLEIISMPVRLNLDYL